MFMCVGRGNMWFLCVCVKEGSFHPVNRYSFFFATNVKGEKFVCVKARGKGQWSERGFDSVLFLEKRESMRKYLWGLMVCSLGCIGGRLPK